jgi:hypothetical protein
MEQNFWFWYGEKIKAILKDSVKSCGVRLKKARKLVERILKILDLVDPFTEAMIALVGILTVLMVPLLVMLYILPVAYCLYSLITAPIYVTLFAHGCYRDSWPYE